jgi:tripartite-type tricarboxylate transporter receptor subunit TctC
MRTAVRAVLTLSILSLAASHAMAQAPARILSGFPPGGAVDVLARIFAEKWGEAIGRPVIVDTRAGATGQIALEALKASAPDGNTVIVSPDSNIVVYPHTVSKPAFDTLRDFIPVAHVGRYDLAVAVKIALPVNTLAEFLTWARANPKDATYGTAGNGTLLHFYGLILGEEGKASLSHVAYRGAGPAVTDLVGGHVTGAILPLGTLVQQARSGKVKILAISGGQRSVILPDAPTVKELGYPKLELSGWFGVFAPAGTSTETVQRLNDIFRTAAHTSAVREKLLAAGLEPENMTPAALAAVIKRDYDRWGPVIKASGFTADSN